MPRAGLVWGGLAVKSRALVLRRYTVATVVALCTMAGTLVFASVSALAFGEHVPSGSFGSRGAGPGQLSEPEGVAVSEVGAAAGDVYVADKGNNRVEVFSSTGAYIEEFNGSGTLPNEGGKAAPGADIVQPEWVAVDNSTSPLDPSAGDVYVSEGGYSSRSSRHSDAVDKFSSSGAYLGQLTKGAGGESFPEGVVGLAVDPSGTLWVAQETGEVDSFSDAVLNEFIASRGGGTGISGFAVDSNDDFYVPDFNSGVNKRSSTGELIAHYFEQEQIKTHAIAIELSSGKIYTENINSVGVYNAEASPVERLGEGLLKGSGVAVSSVSGVVFVADSAADVVDTFTPLHHAGIRDESATNVLSGSTTLRALVNPDETSTTYHFEYDTSAYEGATAHGTSLPVPDISIGSGSSAVPVSVLVEGLQPATTYHYRVVATSEISPGKFETFDGPDQVLTTPTASGELPGSAHSEGCANEQARTEQAFALALPDCRAYEMVSPLDKGDSNVLPAEARAAVSGDGLVYQAVGSFAQPKSAAIQNPYIARRGPAGWSSQSLSPAHNGIGTELVGPLTGFWLSPELSSGLVRSSYTPLTSDTVAGYVNLYVENFENGAFRTITTAIPPNVERYDQKEDEEPQTVGVSTDLSRVAFQMVGNLTPQASGNGEHVYEGTGGGLGLVDVAPEGKIFEEEDAAGAGGAPFGSPQNGDVWRAVSADGSRVIFTAGEGYTPAQRASGQATLGQIYERDVPEAKTIEVSTSQKTNGAGPGGIDPLGIAPARYWGASTDGSKVFFTSMSELTNDANTGPADNKANLYEYNIENGALTDLTVDTNAGDPYGADVLGLVTASDDGSYVYFVAKGYLAEHATSGRPNLYLYHAGKVGFIATLASATSDNETNLEEGGDSRDWYGAQPSYENQTAFVFGPEHHSARVSSGGTSLAFESERPLTGYDSEAAQPGDCATDFERSKIRCTEVYVYNARTAQLTCASCNPSGSRPLGPSSLENYGSGEGYGGFSYFEPRNFSENGERLFFQSGDALVPHDTDGEQDVYEYEKEHVYPISNVAGDQASYFLDASKSGNDVFIATSDQLLPSDTDSRIDAYDVRVAGGFPISVMPPACDNGDSCKAPVSPQPALFGPPASATFTGAGNVAPVIAVKRAIKVKAGHVRCKRGFGKKQGRCVRLKPKRSSRHSKKGRK
jgi:hypothetical protein